MLGSAAHSINNWTGYRYEEASSNFAGKRDSVPHMSSANGLLDAVMPVNVLGKANVLFKSIAYYEGTRGMTLRQHRCSALLF